MDKIKFPRQIRVYIPLVFLFLILLFILPRAGKFNYEFKKGQPWMYDDLYARFDIPIIKGTADEEAEREQIARQQTPFYHRDNAVRSQAFGLADKLPPAFSKVARTTLKGVYDRGLCDRLPADAEIVCCYEIATLVDTLPAVDLYTLEAARALLRARTRLLFEPGMDSLAVERTLDRCLIPNLTYDEARTRAELAKSLDNVAHFSGIVYTGDRIISKGEIVTAQTELILLSYRMEFDQNYGYEGNRVFLWLGNGLIAFLFVGLLFFSILFTNARIFEDNHRYLYLLTIFLITQLIIFLIGNPNPLGLYATPFSLMALFLLSFFRKKVVLPVYLVSLIPMLMLPMGVRLFFVWGAAGVLNIYTFSYLSKGWRQFVNALCTFLLTSVVYFAFQFAAVGVMDIPVTPLVRLLLASFLAVAAYPLIYLFEKIFSLVSANRLEDLSDTNAPLLQQLARSAAGTYQHSLQVMTMSEMVARAIGADVALIRAGALYHDVGKLQNPQCFVENQLGSDDYHKALTPEESARQIIRHVADGEVYADKFGLPEVLKRFIRTHHGTSCAAYFYARFLEGGGDPQHKSGFCYPGPKPKSVEETVVMICDSVEAASRTLKTYSDASISDLVDGIVEGKFAEDQFSESELSLAGLKTVKEEICNYLHQVHHARIVYPKIK